MCLILRSYTWHTLAKLTSLIKTGKYFFVQYFSDISMKIKDHVFRAIPDKIQRRSYDLEEFTTRNGRTML